MEEYKYKITRINEKERWIFLYADEWDIEETDSFVYLVKKIRDDLQGKVIDKGMTTYSIDNDPLQLVFQWDSLFGITVVYPSNVSKDEAVSFLNKYL